MDLGADEMGELIVSGYVDSTRIFSRPHSSIAANTLSLASCDQLYYFNVHCEAPADYVGPQFNYRNDAGPFLPVNPSGRPEWYAQLGPYHNPFTSVAPPHAFTEGQHATPPANLTRRYSLTNASFNPGPLYPFFMRSRVCDIGPHLADDIFPHPIPDNRKVDYSEYVFTIDSALNPNLFQNDIFQANPWFSAPLNAIAPEVNDNRHLYIKPSANQRLRSGTLAPPLVVVNDPLQTLLPKSYLFRNSAHPVASWQPGYSVNAKGYSSPQTMPYASGMEWYGIRVNMELLDPDNPAWIYLGSPVNNVQTYLIVQGAIGGEAPSGAGGEFARTAAERERVREASLSTMRDIAARRRR